MKKALIILLALVAINATAQIEYGSEWKKARKTTWKKTAINVGSSILSVALEMTGDALYDMGKESGNKSQMQWGHTLQATGFVVPLVTIPFLVKDSPNKVIKDVAIIVGTYGLMRFATADLGYNITRGLDPLYAGVTTEHDNIMSKMPPSGRAFLKGISFTLGVSINIKYW